jgi:hypothetical protein
MLALLLKLAPVYLHNLELRNYVAELTHRVEDRTKSDEILRALVLNHAAELSLPVTAENVHISRTATGQLQRIEIRYFVPVELPGYSVNLHFYPSAGSR